MVFTEFPLWFLVSFCRTPCKTNRDRLDVIYVSALSANGMEYEFVTSSENVVRNPCETTLCTCSGSTELLRAQDPKREKDRGTKLDQKQSPDEPKPSRIIFSQAHRRPPGTPDLHDLLREHIRGSEHSAKASQNPITSLPCKHGTCQVELVSWATSKLGRLR